MGGRPEVRDRAVGALLSEATFVCVLPHHLGVDVRFHEDHSESMIVQWVITVIAPILISVALA